MKHISEISKQSLIDIAISQKENSSKKSKLELLWKQGILSSDEYYSLITTHNLRGA
jgi:hypothetical protein